MDLKDINKEIGDIEKDLAVLETDIDSLKNAEQNLIQEVDVAQASLHAELERRDMPNNDEENDSDVNIQDEGLNEHDTRVDDYISTFFESNGQPSNKKPKVEKSRKEQLERTKRLVDLKESILYENMFRLAGMTSFPLNEYMFEDSSKIIGLRFDILSHFLRKYITPHYVILRKLEIPQKTSTSTAKWTVYRHTLPSFIPLSKFCNHLMRDNQDEGLLAFATEVRSFLLLTQLKHDTIDTIAHSTPKKISLEKDLQCQNITLHFDYGTISPQTPGHKIHLQCSLDKVTRASIQSNETKYSKDISICEELLRNRSFFELESKLQKVLQILQAS